MCAAVYRQRHLVKAMEVSNGSLLPGLWRDSLHVTCGLTACTPGSAPGPTLGNEYGKTLSLPLILATPLVAGLMLGGLSRGQLGPRRQSGVTLADDR